MPKPSEGVKVFLNHFLESKVFEISRMNVLDYNFTGGAVKKFLKSLKYYRFEDINYFNFIIYFENESPSIQGFTLII